MGVRFYDEALLRKLNTWAAGTNTHITGVDESKRLFELISDTQNDRNIQLPLIALSRKGGYLILNKNKRPISCQGVLVQANQQKSATLNAVPIGISYQIDIYTRYLAEADEYARNIVFNIINYPKLNVDIPYEDLNLTHDANIRIVTEVEDNSDIAERLIPGQFTRLTIGIDIDDAYLFDVRIKDNVSIVSSILQIANSTTDNRTELIF